MRIRAAIAIVGALGTLLAAAPVRADVQEAREFEPVSIEEVLPTEHRETDVRLGTRLFRFGEAGGSDVMLHFAQVFVGVAPRISLEAGMPYVMHLDSDARRSGAGSFSLGAKARLTNEETLPIVLRLETTLPASDEAFGETHAEFEWGLGTAWRNERFALQGDVGGFSMVGAGEHGAFYEASLATPLAPSAALFAEAAGTIAFVEGGREHAVGIGPGLQFGLTPRMSLAVGALFGVGESAGTTVSRVHVQTSF